MTQQTRPHPALASSDRDPVTTLRRLFQANGTFSLLTGAIATIDAGPTAEFLDLGQVWLVRAVGVGLIAFAVMLFTTSRQSPALMKMAAPAVSAGDLGWVLATIVIIAFGWLSGDAALLMTAIAVVVLVFGVGQFLAGRRIVLH